MKIALILSAALVAATASAEDPTPYVVHDGRGASAAAKPAQTAPAVMGTTSQTSTFGSSAVHPTVNLGDGSPAALAAAAAAATSAASGTHNFQSKRSSSKTKGIGTVRKDTSTTPPPNYSKPGALIRTEGQLPTYTATNDATTHAVEGGTFVSQDPRHTTNSNGVGVTWGAPDKAPTANPGSGSGSSAGGNAITSNGGAGGSGSPVGSTRVQTDNGQGNGNNNGHNAKDSSVSGFDPAF